MKEPAAVVVGIAVVPVIPAATLVAIAILYPVGGNSVVEWSPYTISMIFLAIYLFCLSPMILLGLPASLVGRYFKLVRWWSALIVGCSPGALMAVLIPLYGGGTYDFLLNEIIGAASGLVFWAVWGLSQGGARCQN